MKNISTFLFVFISLTTNAQEKSLAEKLGYSITDKLLIIHADDIGAAHSENVATIASMTKGVVNSTSIMMPCAWSTEVGELIQDLPDLDIGVHITLTNEWENYKWRTISSEVPGLLGPDGYMYPDCASVAINGSPEEVEKEMRAQIEAALRIGIKPTHLDSHMGCVYFGRPEYLASFINLAKEYGIPPMLNKEIIDGVVRTNPTLFEGIDVDNLPLVDQVGMLYPNDYDQIGSDGFYTNWLNNLSAGVNVLLIHVAYDDAEMQAVTIRHPHFNALWRQADFDFFTSEKARKLINDNDIKLVTWKQIGSLIH
ncbi:polysaccharide deacetylase family protein [Aquiflexum sp.]|uniref:polysaccharide deacetylase family protein n=1 Tax=Aquiflexum sp. TaxID=1872584 RepID=UPI0035948000